MIEFYDHEKTGKLYLRATAGGGCEQTGMYDAPAKPSDINAHRVEYDAYLLSKDETKPLEVRKQNMSGQTYVEGLEAALRKATRTIEALRAENARLKGE